MLQQGPSLYYRLKADYVTSFRLLATNYSFTFEEGELI
jgi:hypothetical protein